MMLFSSKRDGLFAQIIRRLITAVVLFALLDIVFVLATYISNVEELGQRLITRQANEIAEAVHAESGTFVYDKSKLERESIGEAKLAFAVYDKGGREITINGSPNLTSGLMPPITSVSEETRRDEYTNSFRLRGIRRIAVDDEFIWVSLVVEGSGLRPFLPVILLEVIDHVALPLIPLSALLLMFNIIAVRRTLRPLTKAIEQIDAIDPREIEQRLEIPVSPREVRHLATAMNAALNRLESAIRSLREFTADTAHELRTPLAIMTMEVEQLPEGAGKTKLQNDLDGMTRLVAQMLDMAYADALLLPEDAKADLSQVAHHVITQLTPLALRLKKGIIFDDANHHVINGHAEAIGRALRNVIENALAHTPVDTDVTVSIGTDARLLVRDHGPGIPAEQRDASLHRFWRGERKKTSGAGLGLAIAARIAKAHGGHLEIDAAEGGGAIVSLILEPTAASEPHHVRA